MNVIRCLLFVTQGSVLSPYRFALYLADGIIILSTTLTELQRLLCACEKELTWLDMSINIKKSCCLRIGHRLTSNAIQS